MWQQFYLENFHFGVNLFTSLAFFAIFWLYLDAWNEKGGIKFLPRIIGFLLLSIYYLIHSISIETSILESPLVEEKLLVVILSGMKIVGATLIILTFLSDPILAQPKHESKTMSFFLISIPLAIYLDTFYLILIAFIGLSYLRRATLGFEHHLRRCALGFFVLSLSSLISLHSFLRETGNIDLYKLFAPFGPLWTIELLLLFVSAFILSLWVFKYLFKRFQTQLFMIFTASILLIFLTSSVSFSTLLLKNLQNESLDKIETDVKVLNYVLDARKGELLSDAKVIAGDSELITSITEGEKENLGKIASNFLLKKEHSSLVILDGNGQVLARGEDKERVGDSLSDDSLVKRVLSGEDVSTVVSKDLVLAPEISIRSGTPVKNEDKIVGVVVTAKSIDNAFMDGIKETTGLEASVYGENVLSATTLVSEDKKNRWVGVKEENKKINETVLQDGESYSGSVTILNVPYFAAYFPLKDLDQVPIGMLFVGKPQINVLATAGKSIELTYLVTVFLIILSVLPSYLISRHIASQIK